MLSSDDSHENNPLQKFAQNLLALDSERDSVDAINAHKPDIKNVLRPDMQHTNVVKEGLFDGHQHSWWSAWLLWPPLSWPFRAPSWLKGAGQPPEEPKEERFAAAPDEPAGRSVTAPAMSDQRYLRPAMSERAASAPAPSTSAPASSPVKQEDEWMPSQSALQACQVPSQSAPQTQPVRSQSAHQAHQELAYGLEASDERPVVMYV